MGDEPREIEKRGRELAMRKLKPRLQAEWLNEVSADMAVRPKKTRAASGGDERYLRVQLKYNETTPNSGEEFAAVDWLLRIKGRRSPVRIQEKALKVEKKNGKSLGLRAGLTSSNKWKSTLNVYPDAPGVRAPRLGDWCAESYVNVAEQNFSDAIRGLMLKKL
eukprot:g14295.t1